MRARRLMCLVSSRLGSVVGPKLRHGGRARGGAEVGDAGDDAGDRHGDGVRGLVAADGTLGILRVTLALYMAPSWQSADPSNADGTSCKAAVSHEPPAAPARAPSSAALPARTKV